SMRSGSRLLALGVSCGLGDPAGPGGCAVTLFVSLTGKPPGSRGSGTWSVAPGAQDQVGGIVAEGQAVLGARRDQSSQAPPEATSALLTHRSSSTSCARSTEPSDRLLISWAASRYASAPREPASYWRIVIPYPGASDTFTLRGITVRRTASPKCSRTSPATCSASLVRPSYMVSMMVEISSPRLRCCWISSTLRSSCPTPSRA